MDEALRQFVRARAKNQCEYCHLPQAGHEERFSVDHVVATKHGGEDVRGNLALSCLRCNLHKGTDLTAVDPGTYRVVRLFNPRRQKWRVHFQWNGAVLRGLTPTGRATISLLRMNDVGRIRLRESLAREGLLRFS